MTYLILDQDDTMLDMIEFGSPEDLKNYQVANPDHVLELTDDLDEDYLLNEDNEADEW